MRPKITVVIPTFNRADYLPECLESLLSQTIRPAQILVINDGSTDHTSAVVTGYSAAVEHVETAHVGTPGALNAGLGRATGDFVWTFGDDDVALPDALERLVEPLEHHPEHGFSFSTCFYAATRPEDGRIGPILGTSAFPPETDRGLLLPLLEANFLGGPCMLARRSCYQTVGKFDPRLLRSQDYEMAIRIARRFTGTCVAGGPTFYYRQHAAERGSAHDRFQVHDRGRKWLQYDQLFFRELYHELPLADYLPPGSDLGRQRRQAHLQRLAIMGSKLLMPEVMSEVQALAALSDASPLSAAERRIIRDVVNRVPHYGQGGLSDHLDFFTAIRRHARASPVIGRLRTQLLRTLVSPRSIYRGWRSPRRVIRALHGAVCLYVRASRTSPVPH